MAVRSADKTGVTLTWTLASGGDAATGFAIYNATTSSGPFTSPGQFVMTTPATTYTVGGLSATQTNYLQVYPVNAKGASAPVSVISAP